MKVEDGNPARLAITDSKRKAWDVFSKVGDLLDVIQGMKKVSMMKQSYN